ncbi:hypothetical protein HK104_001133 [Borealophlyctis nickersoniae]|nr:hypothetical protein HK104_001133 [Borealophlyctis nickersoniae]
MGLPLQFMKLNLDANQKLRLEGVRGNGNQSAVTMNMRVEGPKIGWAPLDWSSDPVINAVVVRKDRKPLKRMHMEWIWKYFEDVLIELFGKVSENPGNANMKRAVDQATTRKAFMKFVEDEIYGQIGCTRSIIAYCILD